METRCRSPDICDAVYVPPSVLRSSKRKLVRGSGCEYVGVVLIHPTDCNYPIDSVSLSIPIPNYRFYYTTDMYQCTAHAGSTTSIPYTQCGIGSRRKSSKKGHLD
uniref:Uncharacterized protein n=1 Tax=Cacopsylla melanoneura TaxID=428564 RepID=A0A8D8QNM8_9HEMI